MSKLPKVSISELLDAGIHFGHKASRWNPKMAPYIYGVRDGVHIIDLQQTVPLINTALKQIYETVKNNGKVLFVSGKVQATDLIAEYAEKCGQFYVNSRWLGGTLTNWATISKSIKKLETIEKMLADDEKAAAFTKKEMLDLSRKKEKLMKAFSGIRNIGGRPDLVIVIDTNKEHLAIKESVKMNIPIVGVVDSNSDPDLINFPIPGNDDAIRSIRLYCTLFADAALAGIQDAMSSSGVDVGAAKKNDSPADKNMENVTKIKSVAKVSNAVKVAEAPAVKKEVKEEAAPRAPQEKTSEEKPKKVEAKKAAPKKETATATKKATVKKDK